MRVSLIVREGERSALVDEVVVGHELGRLVLLEAVISHVVEELNELLAVHVSQVVVHTGVLLPQS